MKSKTFHTFVEDTFKLVCSKAIGMKEIRGMIFFVDQYGNSNSQDFFWRDEKERFELLCSANAMVRLSPFIDCTIQISEAWFVKLEIHKGENPEKLVKQGITPSNHPQREEGLILFAELRDGEKLLYQVAINRNTDGLIESFGTPYVLSSAGDEMAGMLINAGISIFDPPEPIRRAVDKIIENQKPKGGHDGKVH